MDEKLKAQGMFSWNELITGDVEGAKSFYSQLLGWTTEDMPMDDMTYTVVAAKGEEIGGILPMPPQAEKMPPTWGVYISVDDVDGIAGKSVELGGKILLPPRDIPQVGRFALIQDPQGAIFSVIRYVDQQG